ncbi:hypothetical protein BY996DRAFT_8449838 [Phakopsora pachyrhizi]|nr:hypothetical protein BY996DRAFT_8449838 [Phakopsora pachyrhizi]
MDGDETMEVEIGLDTPGTVDKRSAQDSIAPDLGAVVEDTSLDKKFESNNGDGDLILGVENKNINFEKSTPGQITPCATTPAQDPQLTPRASNQNQSKEEIITKGQPPKKSLRCQLVDLVTELDPADHPSSSLAPKNPSHHELLPKLLEVDGQNCLMAAPIKSFVPEADETFSRIGAGADNTFDPRAKGETSKLDIFDEPGNTQPSQSKEAETELLRNQTSGLPNPSQIDFDNINLVCKTLNLSIVEMVD